MDERKKIIKQLESQNKEAQDSINRLMERLGETLLSRLEEAKVSAQDRLGESAEYRRLHEDIADSKTQIAAVEEAMLRLKELEDHLTQGEQDHTEQEKELTRRSIRLGELILEEPALEDVIVSYKRQIEVLIPKIHSLEDRLEKLEDKSQSHIFAWIGKSAQGMVLRSFLENSQESLRRIYGNLGEQFVLPSDRVIANEAILVLAQEIETLRTGISRSTEEIAALKIERRKLSDAFRPEGNPLKQIQDMEKHIAHVREELKVVYLKAGIQAAQGVSGAQFSDLLQEEDLLLLDEAKTIREVLQNTERHIEKLRAALAIDREKQEIEKMRRIILEHRRRITAAEEAIEDLEKRITDANHRIEALTQFL